MSASSQAIDNHHAAARAVALVARRCEIFTRAAFGFLNRFLDHVGRHLILLGAVNQATQGQVASRVYTALFGNNVNLTSVLAVYLGLGVRRLGHRFFAVLIGSAHSSYPLDNLISTAILAPERVFVQLGERQEG